MIFKNLPKVSISTEKNTKPNALIRADYRIYEVQRSIISGSPNTFYLESISGSGSACIYRPIPSISIGPMTDKVTVVRLTLDGEKFELLVKPEQALEYKVGKRSDISSVLVSDDIYSDANKGSRASGEKLMKHFKTTDAFEVALQIITRGDLNLTTEQRRKMVDEKKKQIVQYVNKNFVDPRTHAPHPIQRIESALEEARIAIDPFKRADDQAKVVMEAIRKILPLKSEILRLTVTVPAQYSAQSFSVLKAAGELKGEEWLPDGSLKVVLEVNASTRGNFLERLGSSTKGSADVREG